MTNRSAPTHRARVRRVLSSTGILGVLGLFTLTFALPGIAPVSATQSFEAIPVADAAEVQQLEVSEAAEVAEIERSDYDVTTYAELLQARYGNAYGGSVGGTGSGSVRWPFPYAVRMTDGFGPRAAPCSGCSTMHRGIDLLPGAGTPIYAIADGVVSGYQEGWGYGTHVFIDHTIDGQSVTSLYAHMQTGSSPLSPGDTVAVGDFIGLVGATGAVTAPHLHLEIRVDGVAINPLPWLAEKTGR